MQEHLRRFNGDIHTKQAVIDFLTDFIAQEAIARTFARADVSHIADAKELIDSAFEHLAHEYGIKEQVSTEVSNQSR